MKILLIDNDTSTLEILQGYLSGLGHLVTAVSDGINGLRLCAFYRYDLVLCDLNMPVMSGLSFLNATRASDIQDEVRVVILSDEINETAAQIAREKGAIDFWIKPQKLDVLGELVEQFKQTYCPGE